jgi:hypothetical protein
MAADLVAAHTSLDIAMPMTECRTLSVSIARPPKRVYDYLADPGNFPRWSRFITGIRAEGNRWIATTPRGEVTMRFTPPNDFGILDHWVSPRPDVTVYVPLRVLANGDGSEVIFSVFRQPGMSDPEFAEDMAMVRRDLDSLQQTLERG